MRWWDVEAYGKIGLARSFSHKGRIFPSEWIFVKLDNLKATEHKSKNYQFLEDYAVWWVNYQ